METLNVSKSQNLTTLTLMHNVSKHVKKSKRTELWGKKYTFENSTLSFLQFSPFVPKNSKTWQKIKNAIFLCVIIWRALHKRNFPKSTLQQFTMLSEFYNMLVSCSHVGNMLVTFPTKTITVGKYDSVPRPVYITYGICLPKAVLFMFDNALPVVGFRQWMHLYIHQSPSW